jgi:uncharacterized oligopeptide transporter (OPT) family protein
MTGTIRLYYDAVIAVALMTVVAAVCGFVAAMITGSSPPSFPVAAIAFLLTGAVLFFRLWHNSRPISASAQLTQHSAPSKLARG